MNDICFELSSSWRSDFDTTPIKLQRIRDRQRLPPLFLRKLRGEVRGIVGQVAILSKYQAQAAWSEPWKSMNGVDPPRGFAFAWFKIGNEDIGVYSVHLKSPMACELWVYHKRPTAAATTTLKRNLAVRHEVNLVCNFPGFVQRRSPRPA